MKKPKKTKAEPFSFSKERTPAMVLNGIRAELEQFEQDTVGVFAADIYQQIDKAIFCLEDAAGEIGIMERMLR